MGVLRTRRTVLQQCKIAVPWARAGQVAAANSGEVAAEHGLLGLVGGSTYAAPEPPPKTIPRPAVRWVGAAVALTVAACAVAAGLRNRRMSAG